MIAERRLSILGGISGIVGTLCYIIGITMSFSPALTYAVVMAWPVLSIVFAFALNRCVALEKDTASNQLAFVFACLGFTLVASMMSVQLAVETGMDSSITNAPGSQQELLTTAKHSMRWIDLGIDVAWDIFIGTALLFLSIVLSVDTRFGFWWGIPSGLLGAALIIFNTFTFPWPPAEQGLVDIGPVIGLFIIALSARLLMPWKHLRATSTPIAGSRSIRGRS